MSENSPAGRAGGQEGGGPGNGAAEVPPGGTKKKVNLMDVLCPSLPKKTLRTFAARQGGSTAEAREVKIICLNVNGIRSAVEKGLAKFVAREEPDILCLGETKLGEKGFEKASSGLLRYSAESGKYELFPGYEHVFNCSRAKEGYASSAVLVRSRRAEELGCQGARLGIGLSGADSEGRVITLEFPRFYLVHAYVPNSGRGGLVPQSVLVPAAERAPKPSKPQGKSVGLMGKESSDGEDKERESERDQEREKESNADAAGALEPQMVRKKVQVPGNLGPRGKYEEAIKKHILSLSTTGPRPKPVIYCGDLNVAHQPIDLYSPETNTYSPGFTDDERGWLSALLAEAGLVDTFRERYPDKVQYSWYSMRANGKATGRGWRIDYFLVSRALAGSVLDSLILEEAKEYSDHIPIMLRVRV